MQQQLRLTEEERTNLVAFVDGELDETEAIKLEEKIAKSVSAQKEVQALEKTWAMLDWLPRPEVPDNFATQTLELIHSQQMRTERIEGLLGRVLLVVAQALGWLACVAAVAFAGFALVRYAWPDKSRELIEHLDIVENFETYRAVPDLKFVEDLSRLGLFVEPTEPPAEPPAGDASNAPAN